MKHKFTFERLIAIKKEFSIQDKEIVFFSMHDLTRRGVNPIWIDTLAELESVMIDDEYYIALNIITTKGKKKFFKGMLVSCLKNDLLRFLNEEFCAETGCSRPFIISPLFSTRPKYVISITEEAGIRYYICDDCASNP
ncbi:TPA: hypothetical protein LC219_004391 [Salmonella enterica subsp. enterica serovar Teltow]|uniref:hypothetical protein n=1 Tax=Salmonella enterica TaxID=28901 RepID=UPI00071DAA35|nr:hypothetical protein [Salmonella enterica]EAA4392711.1 hypothetical protein [Salmonella enterica subsp. enterica serovar Adjame]EAA5208211.1 hypothetical protein [Salmonella enterica subsp. enterica serovar Aba]EAB8294038.1 hypothetical protein [Salmonella enterica subsp. enterica serovar Bracknell]ECB1782599.1 hypothetical protein [Salmonella enterica subsp. enterica serovar Kibi]ECF3418251.1 hypothetical protein [Salmonella enterica subsp. enterica serovar Linton]ECY8231934.1 hypothetica